MLCQRIMGAAFLTALATLVGCASDNTAEVRGTVKYNGEPVEKAILTFMPTDPKLQAKGGYVLNGRYSTQVFIGENKVSISMSKQVGSKKLYPDDPKSPEMPVTAEVLPPRYNEETELKIDVKPGVNEKDFDLKGD